MKATKSNTTVKLTKANSLFPEKTLAELTPSEFLREYRKGRPDMDYQDKKPEVANRSEVLADEQIRYIRQNYKALGKVALADTFGLSAGFIYKVASKRCMGKVSDEGIASVTVIAK